MEFRKALIATAVAAAMSAHLAVAADPIDDAALTAKVKMALIANPATKARQIDVESRGGTVQLNGFVDSDNSRKEAATVAMGVEGVARVENNLEVKAGDRTAGEAIDDASITGRVKAALLEDPSTKGSSINIETREGVVQLNGFVDGDIEKDRAAKLAAAVSGVKSVDNNLTVQK